MVFATVPTLPAKVFLGLYLGVLTGIIPAFVSWGLAVLFRTITGLTVPSFAVVVLGVAIAGVNGGFLAFNDPSVVQSANSVTLVTALLVVMLVSFYAHNLGDQLGATLPKRLTFAALSERTLSRDVIEFVSGHGQVRIEVVGPVGDIEGYPPLPADIRGQLEAVEWTFPADLPLSELEDRIAERFRAEFDLAEVAVAVDERARATVAAAPPSSVLSRRVPADRQAVSVAGLVPTGLARGDEVTVLAGETTVSGVVVSARSGVPEETPFPGSDEDVIEADEAAPTPPARAPTTAGGEGRLTVAVDPEDTATLLGVDRGRIVVAPRGTRREFELVSLLRRAGRTIRRVAVRAGGALDGTSLDEIDIRERYGVAVLAVRVDDEWTLAPGGETRLSADDGLFVVGTRDALDRFEEAAA